MAHIEKRRTSKGQIRYRAQIVLKGHPRVSETFSTRREAKRWAERTTEAMRQRRFEPGSESEQRTMGDLVGRYIEEKLPHLAGQKQTRRKLEWWAGELGQDTRLCQITPASIDSHVALHAAPKGPWGTSFQGRMRFNPPAFSPAATTTAA